MRALVFLIAAASLDVSAQVKAVPDLTATRAIQIVIPRDGWRLTVEADGAARINYAALPQTARADAGALEFGALYAALAGRVIEGPCADDRIGRVEFTGDARPVSPSLWCLSDVAFAMAQFDRVWARIAPEPDAVGREHVEMLRRMWEGRQDPR